MSFSTLSSRPNYIWHQLEPQFKKVPSFYPSLSMNGMSQYLMLFSAHCCKASLKISWDRRCANSQTTVSDPEDSFASSLLTGEGVLGGTLSPDMKLSALACRLSLSIVVGNGNVCFDFMQPMLGRASTERSTAVSGKDYFSIFGKHQTSVPVVTDPCFSTPGRFRTQCPGHHSSHEVFICQDKRSFILKVWTFFMSTFTWHHTAGFQSPPSPPCRPGPGAIYEQGPSVSHQLPALHQVNGRYFQASHNRQPRPDPQEKGATGC